MKKILLTLLICFTSISIYSQNLTLSQLLELKKKDLGNAEEYLTEKGWKFLKAEEPNNEYLGKAVFTYKKNSNSDLADSNLTYFYYEDYPDKVRIFIDISERIKYNEYLDSIKSYGCKLISSKILGERIWKIYRGETTTFELIVPTTTGKNSSGEEIISSHLSIFSNDDYILEE